MAKGEKAVAEAPVRTMPLPVALSAGEVSIRAQELAQAERKAHELERDLERTLEAWKGERKDREAAIASERAQAHRLADVVAEKRETREVVIAEEPDWEAGAMNTIRTDTGEIVATRGLTPEERQRSLFRDAKKAQEN